MNLPSKSFAVWLAAGVLLPACNRSQEPVLARVGGERVTLEDFQQEMSQQPFGRADYLDTLPGRKELLELFVRRKLLFSEAKHQGLERRDDVKKKLEEIDRHFEREREKERERLLIGEYLRSLKQSDLQVTDEQVEKYWGEVKEIRASHIFLDTEAEAADVLEKLKKGQKFEELAKKLSKDPVSASRGGDLGYFLPGKLVPAFEQAVFNLKVGETSGVVASSYGFHIIKKTGERALSAQPFEKVKDALRASMEQKKLQDWLEAKKSGYRIVMDLPALERIPSTGQAAPQPKGVPAPK